MKCYKVYQKSEKEIIKHFSLKEEIVIELNSLDNNNKMYLSNILQSCLEVIDKIGLFNYLNYCLNELLENANRANIKRIFFKDEHLDINNIEDYRKGMKKFSRLIIDNKNHYLKQIVLFNLNIKVSYKIEDDVFIISVKNNSIILNEELNNAREKINNAKIFSSIEEAFLTVQNKSEGGGLGLIIIILILRKLGLTRNSFNIYKSNEETICSIMIPISFISLEQNKVINDIVFNEINNMPQFPEYIIKLQTLLTDKNPKIKEIEKLLNSDEDIKKYITNIFDLFFIITENKKYSLLEIITLIGFKQLNEFLYSYGVIKLFTNTYRTEKNDKIIKHSKKIAFYALEIAKLLLSQINLEETYTSGIIHDIGHILLNKIKERFDKKFNNTAQINNLYNKLIENLTNEYNHAIIGAALAKKWNFPDKYIQAIEFHNNPVECSEDYKKIVYPVYLANIMIQNKEPYEKFRSINKHALYYLKIHSFTQFNLLLDKINEEYIIKNNLLTKAL